MKRPEPTREVQPIVPRPGVEVVYKRFSRLPNGGIICTVSYVESKNLTPEPEKRKALLVRIVGVFTRFRGALSEQLRRLRARIAV
jgi:hypothetical protein